MPPQEEDNTQTITLGGGCFWCTEAVFDRVRGVTDVQSGYSNGQAVNPSYEQVCTGRTGHNEVVRVSFDPRAITLQEILQIFFATHDPTTLNRQGNKAIFHGSSLKARQKQPNDATAKKSLHGHVQAPQK